MNNIVIDLETLSAKPNAAIIQLAAYDIEDDRWFFESVDLKSLTDYKADVELEVIKFWAIEAPDKFRHHMSLCHNYGVSLAKAIKELKRFIGNGSYRLWSRGYSFERNILEFWFSRFNLTLPSFRVWMDVRTAASLFPHPLNTHDAVEDVKHETKTVKAFLKAERKVRCNL